MEDRKIKRYQVWVTVVSRKTHCVEVESPEPEQAKEAAKLFVNEMDGGSSFAQFQSDWDLNDTNVCRIHKDVIMHGDDEVICADEPEVMKEVVNGG